MPGRRCLGCWVTDLYIGSAGWIHCQRLDIADVTKELAAVRQSLAMRFQHIDRDSVTAGENQRGGLSIGPVIYESLWSEQKVTGPYGPVIIPCHWPELARRFQKAGGPAGQCLLWRPEWVQTMDVQGPETQATTEHYTDRDQA